MYIREGFIILSRTWH